MTNLISEIRNSYENKISALQRDIERLRAKMTDVISTLQEDIGDQDVTVTTPKATVTETHAIKKSQMHIDREPNTRIRVINAVERMPLSGFGTTELLRSVNNDGNTRQVNKNRSLKIFKGLINEGIVKVIKKHSGKQGGIYKKVVKEPQADSSPAAGEHNLVSGGS